MGSSSVLLASRGTAGAYQGSYGLNRYRDSVLLRGASGLDGATNGRYFSSYEPKNIRNVAIIAHVDHGKTTLMDKLLAACSPEEDMGKLSERAMDSNEHEKERGITITSKYTRLYYGDHVLHVVDTPGHADFGGEVERILSMVQGVVLLVDASEGPMSQTKFVLSKALGANKPAIVVLNKVDRDGHRAEEVESEIFDLFCALSGDNDDLLEYPLLYASAKNGWAVESLDEVPGKQGVKPLLEAIIAHIPAPDVGSPESVTKENFAMAVNTISTDNHLGRIVTGKVESGRVRIGDKIKVLSAAQGQGGEKEGAGGAGPESKVTKLFYLEGLTRRDVEEARAGEIVSLAGSEGAVSDTVCAPGVTHAVDTPSISPPIISMTFGPNDSPLAGKEGSRLTSTLIKERLQKEIENNVTLALSAAADAESVNVQGRGELQIGILVEAMRREGFELTVSPPAVLGHKDEATGKNLEPHEEVTVDCEPEYSGTVIESMSGRKGDMVEYKEVGNRTRLVFTVPSRGLMGFRHEITSATRGSATVNSTFSHYGPVNAADFGGLSSGKVVSTEAGKTTGYALNMVEERGTLFVGVGEEVYEGMVIGESSRGGEVEVNPCRAKKLSNVRSTGAEEKVSLSPPRRHTVEALISYMDEDEVLEVTPASVRLRKRILDNGARARANKHKKKQQ